MKIRSGFVSNSSSSSFIVKKNLITAKQAYMIDNHVPYARMKGWDCGYCDEDRDAWSIEHIDEDTMRLSTWMDNFSMSDFFDHIGLSEEAYEWQDF